MSDIFISYKREEQQIARRLADALQKRGLSVWWDPELRAGDRVDDVIEKALIDARCIVVLWSKLSVRSKYIRDEASYALDNDKLVPIAIEEVELPFRFKGIQTVKLINWDGSDSILEFHQLVGDIAKILNPPPVAVDKADRAKKVEAEGKADAKEYRPKAPVSELKIETTEVETIEAKPSQKGRVEQLKGFLILLLSSMSMFAIVILICFYGPISIFGNNQDVEAKKAGLLFPYIIGTGAALSCLFGIAGSFFKGLIDIWKKSLSKVVESYPFHVIAIDNAFRPIFGAVAGTAAFIIAVVISYITKLDLVVNYSILNAINEENKVSVIIWRISPTTGAQFVILTLISFMAGFYFINLLKIKKD